MEAAAQEKKETQRGIENNKTYSNKKEGEDISKRGQVGQDLGSSNIFTSPHQGLTFPEFPPLSPISFQENVEHHGTVPVKGHQNRLEILRHLDGNL